MIRRNLSLAAKVMGQTQKGMKRPKRTVKAKVVKPRTTQVPVKVRGKKTTTKRVKTKHVKRITAVRVITVRRQASSIDLLKAALSNDPKPEASSRKTPSMDPLRIRPIVPRTRAVIISRKGPSAPPSLLKQLQYQMDLLQMSEALQ